MSDLYGFLFNNYTQEIRPVCERNLAVHIYVELTIRQIIELAANTQRLTVNAWLKMTWFNCHLTWQPSKYSNITHLVVPFKNVWVPDLTMYDSAGEGGAINTGFNVVVSRDGICQYHYPTVITSVCKIDVTFFPFDKQTCLLTFGSLSYNAHQVYITSSLSSADLSNFVPSTEWRLINFTSYDTTRYFHGVPEPYRDVTFSLLVRRKPFFYFTNLVIPCCLISFVAILGFILPAESGEKISLEITVLLSLSVFLLMVADLVPPSSEHYPLLGLYFVSVMCLVTLSTLLSVMVLNVHHKGNKNRQVPRWLHSLAFTYLRKLDTFGILDVPHHKKISDINSGSFLDALRKKFTSLTTSSYTEDDLWDDNSDDDEDDLKTKYLALLKPVADLLQRQLAIMEEDFIRHEKKRNQEKLCMEWMRVAHILDRFFLIVMTLLITCCTAYFFIVIIGGL
ncbi:neuronal acetylcholine receptor subunit alpha-9-like isoform X2 [Physella acuta]|nr:neuronal acetylcholine receptor subunit alpha-9-like isoform X2 [Physella acuta]